MKDDNKTGPYLVPISEVVLIINTLEVWWETPATKQLKTTHNKPDLITLRKNNKECVVINFCIHLDQNVKTNEKVKEDRLVP